MRRPFLPVLIVAMLVAFASGVCVTWRADSRAQEQTNPDSHRILVHGYGNANSYERPPGQQFTLIAANAPQRSFKTVPVGKTFILTDMMYAKTGRGVRQNLTVNLAKGKLLPEKPVVPYVADILLQTYMKPGESAETHLCTGYTFPSAILMAGLMPGLEPDQWVNVTVTGYLVDSGR